MGDSIYKGLTRQEPNILVKTKEQNNVNLGAVHKYVMHLGEGGG